MYLNLCVFGDDSHVLLDESDVTIKNKQILVSLTLILRLSSPCVWDNAEKDHKSQIWQKDTFMSWSGM